jgi:hypothetical protein
MTHRSWRYTKGLAFAALGLFALLQLVPYGRAHTNPRVVNEPAWDRPSTRALAARACFDCHSNETRWPWYSHVAPFSWLVQHDVDGGRRELNFSEWARGNDEAEESAEAVLEGEMPLAIYVWLHPSAELSPDEKRQLADGLATTFGGRNRGGDDD